MSSIQRMNRSVVKRTTLDQEGKDVGVPHATPADRILMVWPLTLMAWEFKEPGVVQPRLQRHVVRIVRMDIPVIGRNELVVNKRASGRAKDIADAETLDPTVS